MRRIAWFSPLTDRGWCRSAQFTELVLAEARGRWDVELFVDDLEWKNLEERGASGDRCSFLGFPVHHQLRAFLRDEAQPFDAFVYNLEDSEECGFVKRVLPIYPGVCFFHDVNLSRLEMSGVSYATTGEALNRRLSKLFGEEALPLGDWKARGWSVGVADRVYAAGEGEMALAAVCAAPHVHGVSGILDKGLPAPVEMFSHPVEICPAESRSIARESVRRLFGFREEEFVIGFAGRFEFDDRVYPVLEGFERFCALGAGAKLLWAVAGAPGKQRAEGVMDRVLASKPALRERIKIANISTRAGLREVLCATDAVLALKFDTMRGVPLELLQALGCGVPCVTSDFGPSGEIPANVALHIPVGAGEGFGIAEALQELAGNAALRAALTEAGTAYLETVCAPALAFLDVEGIFERHGPLLKEMVARSRGVDHEAQRELMKSVQDSMRAGLLELAPIGAEE